MLNFSAARIYLCLEPTDMRKSFDGLSVIVQHRFHRDPFDGDVFAFFNRRRATSGVPSVELPSTSSTGPDSAA